MRQHRIVGEGKLFRVGLKKEVKGIEDGQLRDEIYLHAQFGCLVREDQPREMVRLRILLPVDEVLFRQHPQRVGEDGRVRMRRGPQPHHMRRE